MNVRPPELADAILVACRRPYGLATAELPGYTAAQLGRMVQKLQSRGLIHRAKIGGKYGRYFETAERAEAYAAEFAKTTPVVRVKGAARLTPDMPSSNPNNVKPVKLPNTLGNRFAADSAPSVISSAECRPWAMAMEGARA